MIFKVTYASYKYIETIYDVFYFLIQYYEILTFPNFNGNIHFEYTHVYIPSKLTIVSICVDVGMLDNGILSAQDVSSRRWPIRLIKGGVFSSPTNFAIIKTNVIIRIKCNMNICSISLTFKIKPRHNFQFNVMISADL